MQNESEKKQPEIKTLTDPITEKVWKMEFSEANTEVIRDMMMKQVYGKTEEEVVLIAVSLLYSIFKVTTKCEFINILDDNGKVLRINLPKIG